MKINKTTLRSLIRECINEMHDEINEASSHKKLARAKPVDESRGEPEFDPKKLKALAKKDMFIAQALKKYKPEIVFNTYVLDDPEMTRQYMMMGETTTGDVAGYDAPMGMKLTDLVDDEDE